MKRNFKGNKMNGYVLLTILLAVISISTLYFVNNPINPKHDLERIKEEWSKIEEVKRAVQYFEIANLQAPTPSQLQLTNTEEYDINPIIFSIPSATPSDNLKTTLPLDLGKIKMKNPITTENVQVDINRNIVQCGIAKRLIYLQSMAIPSTETTPSKAALPSSDLKELIESARSAYCNK